MIELLSNSTSNCSLLYDEYKIGGVSDASMQAVL